MGTFCDINIDDRPLCFESKTKWDALERVHQATLILGIFGFVLVAIGGHLLVDVTQEGEISDAADEIFQSAGRLDIVVNNAGVAEFDSDIVSESVKAIDRTLATNLRGPMLVCKHMVPLLLQTDGGRVVNVSSGMGALGEEQSGGSPAYRVSKTGLNGLTAYLHGEYADQGLLANSVCPGWVQTEMGGEDADRSIEEGAATPTWLSRFRPESPAGLFWRDREVIDW